MPDLTRTRRQQNDAGTRTRIIFVRQPVKSVGSFERDLLPLRLSIGVIAVVGAAGALWLVGFLGFHLGFARAVGVPELLLPAGGGLVAGMRMLIEVPGAVIHAAMAEPVWLMIGFLLIAIPAASLAVIGPPPTPGGPRPHILAVVFSHIGAVASCILALLLVWWTIVPFRVDALGAMPAEVAQFSAWFTDLRIIAGLDALAVTGAALWMVLVMRLVIPRWLKGLSGTAIFAALAIVTAIGSISLGALAQVNAPRAALNDSIVVGRVDLGRVVMMSVGAGEARIVIAAPVDEAAVGLPRSIAGLMSQ